MGQTYRQTDIQTEIKTRCFSVLVRLFCCRVRARPRALRACCGDIKYLATNCKIMEINGLHSLCTVTATQNDINMCVSGAGE